MCFKQKTAVVCTLFVLSVMATAPWQPHHGNRVMATLLCTFLCTNLTAKWPGLWLPLANQLLAQVELHQGERCCRRSRLASCRETLGCR